MFLERAKIGYVCWLCAKDTLDFVSDSELELCESCDKAYSNDYRRKVEERLRENELFIEDDPGDLIPTVDLKIRVRSFKALLGFIDYLNLRAGKGKWALPINPVKEMANNNGRTTFHIKLFVPYKKLGMEYKILWADQLELVAFSHQSRNSEDYRYAGGYEAVLQKSKPKRREPWKPPADQTDKELREMFEEQGLL